MLFLQIGITIWNVDEHVSVNGRNSNVVSERNALWATEWVIFIYLQSKDVESSLIDLHELVIDSHWFLLQYLELSITEFLIVKLGEVVKLDELPDPYHIWVELSNKCGWDENKEEEEDVEAERDVVVPHYWSQRISSLISSLHLATQVAAKDASQAQDGRQQKVA